MLQEFSLCVVYIDIPIFGVGLTYMVHKGQRTHHFLFHNVLALAVVPSV